jgi:hypothetical protein
VVREGRKEAGNQREGWEKVKNVGKKGGEQPGKKKRETNSGREIKRRDTQEYIYTNESRAKQRDFKHKRLDAIKQNFI